MAAFVPNIDHPTPAHMLEAIREELHAAAAEQSQNVPQWILSALRKGATRAFSEHDERRVRE